MRSIILKFCFLSLFLAAVLIACSDDDKSVTPTLDLPVLVDAGVFPAGTYTFCFDQTDASNVPLVPDEYTVIVKADNGFSDTLPFAVQTGAANVPSGDCGLPPAAKDIVPTEYGAFLSGSVYAPGDTVAIQVDVPVQDSVTVEVR